MAVAGTVPAKNPPRFDPARFGRRLRRWTVVLAVVVFTWFFLQFGTAWVPDDMDTIPEAPPGSWCIVDRWSTGLRVGSDVFVDGPNGRLLSRVAAIDDETVIVMHPNARSAHADSRHFGPLPRSAVASTVMVVFRTGGRRSDGR
jgi:hypothetical protein